MNFGYIVEEMREATRWGAGREVAEMRAPMLW
jgi:hypothetical protein